MWPLSICLFCKEGSISSAGDDCAGCGDADAGCNGCGNNEDGCGRNADCGDDDGCDGDGDCGGDDECGGDDGYGNDDECVGDDGCSSGCYRIGGHGGTDDGDGRWGGDEWSDCRWSGDGGCGVMMAVVVLNAMIAVNFVFVVMEVFRGCYWELYLKVVVGLVAVVSVAANEMS